MNRRTEYAIGGVLAATALTAGVVAGCTGDSGSSPSASGTGQSVSPTATASDGGPLTLPSVSASSAPAATTPPAAATTGAAATTPQCATADLNAAVTLVAGSQGAGGASLNITLTNHAGHPCIVFGFPGLGLEDKNSDKQATKVVWDPAVAKTSITLADGASASSTARFDTDVPGPGEPTTGPCESASMFMLVTPPNNETQLVAPIDGTNSAGVTVCESGKLDVYALVPGTTGPKQ